MKKCLYLLSLVFLVSSCTEDVKFNNPAFQSLKNNVFWRAQNYTAYIGSGGNLIVEGTLGYEKVTLQTQSKAVKTYVLGLDDVSKAIFSDSHPERLTQFSTGTDSGSGQIVITEYNAADKTISGTFKFNAVNTDEEDLENPTISFTEGVFYKIPITVGSVLIE